MSERKKVKVVNKLTKAQVNGLVKEVREMSPDAQSVLVECTPHPGAPRGGSYTIIVSVDDESIVWVEHRDLQIAYKSAKIALAKLHIS